MKHTYVIEFTTKDENWRNKRRELGISDISYARFHSLKEAQEWVENYNNCETVKRLQEKARIIKAKTPF